jgi:hypothetical protein
MTLPDEDPIDGDGSATVATLRRVIERSSRTTYHQALPRAESQTCPVCNTEYRIIWLAMAEHEDSQKCLCGHILDTWSGTETARYDVVDKYGERKLRDELLIHQTDTRH